MALEPIPAFPALSDRADGSYNSKAFAWASHMGGVFVPQANALVANLNSIAAGGAYAIPYSFSTGSIVTTTGNLSVDDPAAQSSTTHLYVNRVDARGISVATELDTFDDSSSVVKGSIKLVKVGDPSKWVRYNVTGMSVFSAYVALDVTAVSSSSAAPFVAGDALILQFQRTGDKGDTGVMGVLPRAKFREQRASGTSAGIAVNGANTRDLNTTEFNSISGASLASSSVTLPAGTYDFDGWAMRYSSGSGGGGHKAYLHNVTDNTTVSFGSSGSIGTLGINDRSLVSGRFTIAAAKTFQLRHYIEATSGSGQSLGFASSSGFAEVYSEIEFLKVA